jgi:DNA-binding winged helix-turn-helix (wHTH) protein
MPSDRFEFGAYSLDSQSGMLFREGDHVALPPKAAELLVALVQGRRHCAHARRTTATSVARYDRGGG